MIPRITLVAFEARTPGLIFVAVPDQRGRYVRTDKSVALVGCPHCQSMVGEPCRTRQGYGGGTHAVRRSLAQHRYGHGYRADDVGGPADPEAPGRQTARVAP